MPFYHLTTTDGFHTDSFHLDESALPNSTQDPAQMAALGQLWQVDRRTLRGGRADGVDLIRLDNGSLVVEIVPTRGMGLWRGLFRGNRLGWDSPVRDGPIHPKFVRLEDRGGLGWLDGFDELMVRCGLAHNGPPFETFDPPTGGLTARRTMHPLHGRIANTPAFQVGVRLDDGDGSDRTITVEGWTAESTLFHPQLHIHTEITTTPGSNRLTVHDVIHNRSDRAGEFQLLYHWNFGPPYLGAGASFHAPVETLAPRDGRAAEGIDSYATFGPPEPGFAEQVYLAHLVGTGPDGQTLALLADATRSRAVVLRFARSQLPCFTLWKNTGGLQDGYVTGLEPATNFPHPQAFERARNRVVPLEPGASYQAETTLEILESPAAVEQVIAEIATIQRTHLATTHPTPTEPFSSGR